MTSGDIERYY